MRLDRDDRARSRSGAASRRWRSRTARRRPPSGPAAAPHRADPVRTRRRCLCPPRSPRTRRRTSRSRCERRCRHPRTRCGPPRTSVPCRRPRRWSGRSRTSRPRRPRPAAPSPRLYRVGTAEVAFRRGERGAEAIRTQRPDGKPRSLTGTPGVHDLARYSHGIGERHRSAGRTPWTSPGDIRRAKIWVVAGCDPQSATIPLRARAPVVASGCERQPSGPPPVPPRGRFVPRGARQDRRGGARDSVRDRHTPRAVDVSNGPVSEHVPPCRPGRSAAPPRRPPAKEVHEPLRYRRSGQRDHLRRTRNPRASAACADHRSRYPAQVHRVLREDAGARLCGSPPGDPCRTDSTSPGHAPRDVHRSSMRRLIPWAVEDVAGASSRPGRRPGMAPRWPAPPPSVTRRNIDTIRGRRPYPVRPGELPDPPVSPCRRARSPITTAALREERRDPACRLRQDASSTCYPRQAGPLSGRGSRHSVAGSVASEVERGGRPRRPCPWASDQLGATTVTAEERRGRSRATDPERERRVPRHSTDGPAAARGSVGHRWTRASIARLPPQIRRLDPVEGVQAIPDVTHLDPPGAS